MNYYAAPMEGLTDRIWRQAHQRWFGAPEAPVRYYAPFLSPPENRVLIKKKMAELEPAIFFLMSPRFSGGERNGA